MFTLNPSAVARILGAIAALLLLASLAGQLAAYLTRSDQVYRFVQIVYVDAERNIPTGFSTLLLLLAALLLALIAVLQRAGPGSAARHWAILSFGFLVMAADEAWSFHERLIGPMRRLLGRDPLGILYNAWVIPGMVLVLVLALVFLRFWWRLPAGPRLTFLIAATVYLGGALGVELIGGVFDELYGKRNLTYVLIATVEETLEMAGLIIFIRGLLTLLAESQGEVRLRFEPAREDVVLAERARRAS